MATVATKNETAVSKLPGRSGGQPESGQEADAGEGLSVSISIKPVGICSTCRHQGNCLLFKAARQAIHCCEEFDGSQQGDDQQSAGFPHAAGGTGGVNHGQGPAAGLCNNCDVRLTCMHRQPGVAVQECEDYC